MNTRVSYDLWWFVLQIKFSSSDRLIEWKKWLIFSGWYSGDVSSTLTLRLSSIQTKVRQNWILFMLKDRIFEGSLGPHIQRWIRRSPAWFRLQEFYVIGYYPVRSHYRISGPGFLLWIFQNLSTQVEKSDGKILQESCKTTYDAPSFFFRNDDCFIEFSVHS